MIAKETKIRIARPTDNLATISKMYIDGLGFNLLGNFKDHNGFDGVLIGHKNHLYHFEFTHHRGTAVGKAPTQDNLLIFYLPEKTAWQQNCESMLSAGFSQEPAYNPYWDVAGKTFADIDGYRVVLQNRSWSV